MSTAHHSVAHPRIHAYGTLSIVEGNHINSTRPENEDAIALMLPASSLPQDALTLVHEQDPDLDDTIQVYVDRGSARWVGADGRSHQIGEPAQPLSTEILDALRSQEGLLVSFVDQHSGQPLYWTIFKRGENH